MWQLVIIPIAGLIGYRTVKTLQLKNFELSDFRGFHIWLSTGLLESLDLFVDNLGKLVIVSPAAGAIVRFWQDNPQFSDHLLGRGIDVMLPEGPRLLDAFNTAKASGFNAIGVYPFWKPYKGLHLGIRQPRTKLFKWADIGKDGQHNYVNIEQGFLYG